jgi:hypothetical protein
MALQDMPCLGQAKLTCHVLAHLARPRSTGLCVVHVQRPPHLHHPWSRVRSHGLSFFNCTGKRSPVNRAVPICPRPVSIVLVPERKARHGPDNRSGCGMLAHVPEARPKHGTSYLYSGRAGPFGPPCLCAHSACRAMNNTLTKKAGKYFIFT